MSQISLFNFEEDSTLAQPAQKKPKKGKVAAEAETVEVKLPLIDETAREIEFLAEEVLLQAPVAEKATGFFARRILRISRSFTPCCASKSIPLKVHKIT